MSRIITGQLNVWSTGTSQWQVERVAKTKDVSDFCYSNSDMTDCGWIKIGTAKLSVEITLEEGALVAAQVEVLREQAKAIRAEAHVKASQLEDQIQNLLAITYTPGETA